MGLFLSQDLTAGSQFSVLSVQKPAFTLVSGTVIDAVAALFFVQSNRARQLMTEFFDKLRIDRKLEESLRLANEIGDARIQASLKAVLSLSFADVDSTRELLGSVLGSQPPLSTVVVAGAATIEAPTVSPATKTPELAGQ
jgi:hypothetical protein